MADMPIRKEAPSCFALGDGDDRHVVAMGTDSLARLPGWENHDPSMVIYNLKNDTWRTASVHLNQGH